MSEKSITLTQWTDYLNRRTGGFACSICKHQDWETQASNLFVDRISVANNMATNDDIDQLLFPETVHTEKENPSPAGDNHIVTNTMADNTIVMRCGHCGHLVFFDRAFVEETIHE